jgi:hypothetical protein
MTSTLLDSGLHRIDGGDWIPPAFLGIRRGSLPGCAAGEQSRVCGTGMTSGLYLSFHVLEFGHYL